MSQSAYTGLTAKIMVGDTPALLGYMSGVDLNLTKDIIEIIAFGMQYKEKVPAIKDWSASTDGTLAIAAGNTQKDVYDAFESGEILKMSIYLDDDTYFEGNAFVESFNISAAADDKISITADFAGSGAVLLSIEGELSALVVTSDEGTTTGKTAVTVSGTLGTDNEYVFKTAASVALPDYDDSLSAWTAWIPGQEITATTGHDLVIAVRNKTDKKAKKAGKVTVVSKT